VRIGYFSADFHDHATMYLMAGVFEKHSKSDFEIYAYSYGPNTNDCMRKRLTAAVDKFHNVRQLCDFDIAALARDHEIDIAVDRKGYTQNTRLGIFAFKAAPIQISYIGYPGSLGAPFIDYIIVDPVVIPRAYESAYAEKIIFLPHSYQANDDMRPIAKTVYSRSQLGLPEDAFVLYCFNNSYKITPREFDIWMRVLSQIEASVLWLLEANKWVSQNLRSAAQTRGIDPIRLIFAPKLAHDEYLARHSCADLFIDTFNVNAHTTASDALWAGLPLVTNAGKGFAARVAASLLTAIGLPELIVEIEAAYEALIFNLARSPQKLQAVTKKLAQNRRTSPLFDAALLTNHLETGYRAAYQRWAEQKPSAHIRVGP
jgi:protein O-GlcNAc transferase